MKYEPGEIVVVDWRDALPKEPNKRRPAVVIEDGDLFDPVYPNVIVVPLTTDARSAMSRLSLAIPPTRQNGCSKLSFAIAHQVTTTSKRRVMGTQSRVTDQELSEIRRLVALSVGIS